MTDPVKQPAPAAGATARIPLAPPLEAARIAAERVGRAYGAFRADLDEDFFVIFETPFMGGIVLWDRMSPDEQRRHMTKVQLEFDRLPKLPVATSIPMAAAVREGFESGAMSGYEVKRTEFRAVWVACELAKAIILARASTPSVTAVGSAFTSRFSDCGAQTAARIIQEATGVQTSASFLARTFGLPRVSIAGYDAAVSYALNWFEGIGIKLAPKPGGFYIRGQAGRYVIFMKGGATGGHVVYGEVSASGLQVIDNQLGAVWKSLEAAQGKLGMQATAAYRVESVALP